MSSSVVEPPIHAPADSWATTSKRESINIHNHLSSSIVSFLLSSAGGLGTSCISLHPFSTVPLYKIAAEPFPSLAAPPPPVPRSIHQSWTRGIWGRAGALSIISLNRPVRFIHTDHSIDSNRHAPRYIHLHPSMNTFTHKSIVRPDSKRGAHTHPFHPHSNPPTLLPMEHLLMQVHRPVPHRPVPCLRYHALGPAHHQPQPLPRPLLLPRPSVQ